jgi:hypothetical protein
LKIGAIRISDGNKSDPQFPGTPPRPIDTR